ncbi:SP family sugar:H+ symporter-like MFS transporter [Rhodococcus sp. LBL1]|uniref:SP family sugar:H+ symporter-like MFS transporter n=1 Tax=Prescottella agglutinans TaxID=1644129 RepID=A0ABT6MJ73_9NOCA|nr:sugar porter family MFS transporter [Prescottella agglutinans]MDH6283919.1 SP family sugar:H+ symporter-like MFS transporter [Prescottella agglutinans]MDH6677310.1 SP family sugar:H+ symporter-like MFS transporter [Rhodococcus sp. LBL1]MDH6682396.1 SP family sugar:H+ symporter-like MFS transporter [Rhodococcus sp. LBL2]
MPVHPNERSVPACDSEATQTSAPASGPPDSKPSYKRVIGISLVGAVGGLLFGFDTAVINGAVSAVESSFTLSSVGVGVVVAITLFGAAVGALSAGWLADRIGRIWVMGLAAVIFFLSALGCGLSVGFWDLAVWRLITGVGVGFATVIGPLYIAEIAPAHLRGRLASLQQLAIVLGIFLALVSDSAIAQALGGADARTFLGLPAWRWMFLVGAVPALAYGALTMLIPESPRYLVARGQKDRARSVVVWLHGITTERASEFIELVETTMGVDAKPRFSDLLSRKTGLLPVVWVGLGLAVLQALVGVDVIFYYSTSLWESVGFTESASFGLSVASAIVNVVATVVAIALIDRVGRRRLLLYGSAAMFVSLLVVTIGFANATPTEDGLQLPGSWGPATLVAANAFVVAFAVSWGPVMWVLLGEMFPNSIRGVAISLSASANWGAGVLLNLTFPTLRTWSLPGSYAIYACMALLSWFLVFYYVRETKGLELEETATN